MRKIWKYELRGLTGTVLEMPRDATIVHVGMQGNVICMWALVDVNAEKERRMFRPFGTGHEIHDDIRCSYEYVGTVFDGSFVWHIMEEFT